nr:MAG TPA: hypothetical protein [Caudoviricetes sp.]
MQSTKIIRTLRIDIAKRICSVYFFYTNFQGV